MHTYHLAHIIPNNSLELFPVRSRLDHLIQCDASIANLADKRLVIERTVFS